MVDYKLLHALATVVECGGFEGNAQTLRILTRLEPKARSGDGLVPGGLNLTRATLDAATKYPWARRGAERKFGAYTDDLPALEWLRAGARPGVRSMEAQNQSLKDKMSEREQFDMGGSVTTLYSALGHF